MSATTKTPLLLNGWYSIADLVKPFHDGAGVRYIDDPETWDRRDLARHALELIGAVDGIAARIVGGRVTAIRIEEEEG